MKEGLELYRPSFVFPSVERIPFRDLSGIGIDTILLDVDGTIAPVLGRAHKESLAHLCSAVEDGFVRHVCLISNVGIWPLALRVYLIAKANGFASLSCFLPSSTKPNPRVYERAMNLLGLDAEEDRQRVLVVGDQLTTDIVFANRVGVRSALVPTMPPIPRFKKRKMHKEEALRDALNILFPYG